MRKPSFFIVGAPKCGTTAMNDYLKQHPDIYIPEKKEIHFFGSDFNFLNRITEEVYLSYFSGVKGEKIVGESSVWYLYSKVAACEIKKFSPEAKIIIMLRNPVDMIHSLHSQLLYTGLENISDFKKALAAEEYRKRGKLIPNGGYLKRLHFSKELLLYREVAKFSGQIQRYIDIFGRENIHIIIFDDFKKDTASAYNRTLQFLEVDGDFEASFNIINANKRMRSYFLHKLIWLTPKPIRWIGRALIPRTQRHELHKILMHFNVKVEARPSMDSELRKHLQGEFIAEVECLSKLLNRDLTIWCKT